MNIYKMKEDTGIVESFPVAIVVSLFNRSVTEPLQEGALGHLRK